MNPTNRWLTTTLAMLCLATASPGQQEPDRSGPPATITIIGVSHAPGQFHGPHFSPAHVRASLAALAPTAVGVESNPEWFAQGLHYRATYEARLAVAHAEEEGVVVRGIDWIGDQTGFYAERRRLERVSRERELLGGNEVDSTAYDYGLGRWGQARFRDEMSTPKLDDYELA